MPDLAGELTAFMRAYEAANNARDLDLVSGMIAGDATYWFTDGSYRGLAEIMAAISRTFATIRDETYEISDLDWIILTTGHAVCRYRFSWRGVVGGEPRSGRGRATSVITRRDGRWLITHEHLST